MRYFLLAALLVLASCSQDNRTDKEKLSDCYNSFIRMVREKPILLRQSGIGQSINEITMVAGIMNREAEVNITQTQRDEDKGITVYVYNTPRLGRQGIVCFDKSPL